MYQSYYNTVVIDGSKKKPNIDFAVTAGDVRTTIVRALSELGFQQRARIFVHSDTVYTLDFVPDTPHIDREAVYNFAQIQTPVGPVRVLHLEDAITDRIAAFLHWSDSEALDVAERAVSAARDHLTWERIDTALLTQALWKLSGE